eukprot:scaffold6434_cov71-Cylindrotheca_fusiformis.AAC.2
MQRLSYRILVSCLLGMNLVNASNVAMTSRFPATSPTLDTPPSSPSPLSPKPFRSDSLDAYCSNTLHRVQHDDNASCEDDSVSCSSNPIVSANCCKCKPRCCNQCSKPSSNPEDSGICSNTTTTTTETDDDKEKKKNKVPGMIAYGVRTLVLVAGAVHQSQQPSPIISRKQQQKRREEMPTKFFVATIPSDGAAKDKGASVANVQSLFKDLKGTLRKNSDGDVEDQANEMTADISLADTRHEGDNINKMSSKDQANESITDISLADTRHEGDVEDQANEMTADISLDDTRHGGDNSNKMSSKDQANESIADISLADTRHEGDNSNVISSKISSDADVENQGNEMMADISLADTRHEGDDNNKISSKIATGDIIEEQGGETMHDIPLGDSSNPEDERITEISSEISRSSTSDRAEEGQKTLRDDDNDDVVFVGEPGSFSERTKATAAECPICLEPYRPDDTICVSKSPHCDHIFHRECITAWISEHNLCPLCRVDLMSESKEKSTKK